MARGDLLPALAAGKGDIVAANLTITPERQQQVDFSSPVYPNVSELLVSGPASAAVSSVDDLAGKEVFVRKSSSYYASLLALNKRFAAEKKRAVIIREAPEALEDEDLIEMVNAGLIPFIIVDKHKADFWKQVFPKSRCMTVSPCEPVPTLPGRSARGARSSRPASTISWYATAKGPRRATRSSCVT